MIVGVCLHIPMLASARSMHYVLAGMPWDIWMKIGMPLIIVGLVLVYFGLVPRRQREQEGAESHGFDARAIDGTRLTNAHAWLIGVLLVAIAIDTIKPFTFVFILPSVAKEYGLSTPIAWPPARRAVRPGRDHRHGDRLVPVGIPR